MIRSVGVGDGYWQNVRQVILDETGMAGDAFVKAFEAVEHPRIVRAFAHRFDDLDEFIPGRPDYRQYEALGRMVFTFRVRGQLQPDGSILLVEIDIDPVSPH